MRDLILAIIPHKAVKVRTVADVQTSWLRDAVTAQLTIRQAAGR